MAENMEAVVCWLTLVPIYPPWPVIDPRPGAVSTKPASVRDPQEAEKQRSVPPADGTESTAPEWPPLPPPPPRTCRLRAEGSSAVAASA